MRLSRLGLAAWFAASALWGVSAWRGPAAHASGSADTANVVASEGGAALSAGGSATEFTLALPRGAQCPRDSAEGNRRVQSFMVPSSVDVAHLDFGSTGPRPLATGAAFRQPLYATTSSPYANAQTANADTPGGPGAVVNLPTFNLAVFGPGDVPAGEYLIGVACTTGSAAATTVERVWTARLVVALDAADAPAGIRWKVPAATAGSATNSVVPATAPALSSPAGSPLERPAAAPAAAGPTGTTSTVVSAPPAPTGAPPSFGLPVVDLVSGARLSLAPVALAAWLLVGLFLARAAVLLSRSPSSRAAIVAAS